MKYKFNSLFLVTFPRHSLYPHLHRTDHLLQDTCQFHRSTDQPTPPDRQTYLNTMKGILFN